MSHVTTDVMFGWVDVGKRRFFALLVLMIVVEVVLVVLLVGMEHDRFPPLPAAEQHHLKLGHLRSTLKPRTDGRTTR